MFYKLINTIKTNSLYFNIFIFGVMLIFIFAANYYNIFHVQFLIHDDPVRVYDIQEKRKGIYWLNTCGVFGYYYHYQFASWLTDYNIYIARIFVLFTMTMSSFLFYILIHKYLKFSLFLSLIIAILPNVLPSLTWFPSAINASYPPRYLFIYLGSLILALKYTQSKEEKLNYLLFSVLLYVFFSGMEISIFTLPFTLMLLLISNKFNKKSIYLSLMFSIITMNKVLSMLLINRTEPVDISLENIINRIYIFTENTTPFYWIDGKYALLLLLITMIISMFTKNKNILFEKLNINNNYTYYLYILFIVWSVSNIIIFILFSGTFNVFSLRYGYISSFGISFLSIASIYILMYTSLKYFMNINKIKIVIFTFLTAYLVVTAVYKNIYVKESFNSQNNKFIVLKNALEKITFPKNAQIVVDNTSSYYNRGLLGSTGHLRYMLNRKDISGLIVPKDKQHQFTAHYIKFMYRKNYGAIGLTLNKPTFLYQLKDKKLISIEYLLEYKKDTSWIIYKYDLTTGTHSIYLKGKGKKEYIKSSASLKKNGKVILWGM